MKNLDISVINKNPKTIGTVKWWNDAKGFGFISAPEITKEDIFAHYSALRMPNGGHQTLIEGERVSFDLVTGPKGPQAFEIVPMGKE